MAKKEKISSYQLTGLIITTILGTSVIFVPSITAKHAEQSGWISVLVAFTVGVFAIFIATMLGRRFPDQTMIEYCGQIIGRWPGKLLGMGYVFFYTITGAVIVREFQALLSSMFLPQTPALIISFLLIMMGATAVSKGLEVIVRANEFIFPLFLGSVFAIVLLVMGDVDLRQLTPIADSGLKKILLSSVVPSGWFTESTILLILVPYLNAPNESTRAGIKAITVVTIIQIIIFVTTVSVLGPEITANHNYSFLNLARYIQIAEFLTRVEPLVMIAWVTGVTIKIAVFYYITVASAAQVLGMKDYRLLVFPIGLAFIILSLVLWQNSVQLLIFLEQIWPIFLAFPFQILIPLILLILALLRKKGGAQSGK